MTRAHHKDTLEFFGTEIAVTHSTMDSVVTLPGTWVYGFQFDVPSGSTDTGFKIKDGNTQIKRGGFSPPGTREVYFGGRFYHFKGNIVIERGDIDFHPLFYTILYNDNPLRST